MGCCYVASFKYSPIMWNHSLAIGEPIRLKRHPVRYLLIDSYKWIVGCYREDVDFVSELHSYGFMGEYLHFACGIGRKAISKCFQNHHPEVIVFINLNPLLDRIVISLAKRVNPEVRVVSFLHEPYTFEKIVYGRKRALLLTLYEMLNKRTIMLSDAVILPSSNAMNAFNQYYVSYRGSHRLIYLPFFDRAHAESLPRKYITFAGHIRHGYQKGLDLFLEMIEESSRQNLRYPFQIVTSNNIKDLLFHISPQARRFLKVVSSKHLRDEDICKALKESIAVILLQRRTMQSGVLPMAFMNGAPVVVSNIVGFTQFVKNGKTGYILPVDSTVAERLGAVESIRKNIDIMSSSCRHYYEKTFNSIQVSKHVEWILGRHLEDKKL